MERRKYSFEKLLKEEWEKGLEEDGISARVEEGVIFVLPEIYDEFRPLSHSMNEEDIIKMYNLLYYSKEMFNILKDMDNDKAKEIVDKILTDKNRPSLNY